MLQQSQYIPFKIEFNAYRFFTLLTEADTFDPYFPIGFHQKEAVSFPVHQATVTMQIVAVFVTLFFVIAVVCPKEYCSGEGEIKCDDTTTCEETHYRDIRRSTVGCCQRCVKKLRE